MRSMGLMYTSILLGMFLFFAQMGSSSTGMVPYYLGDTLIMVDSLDPNLPARYRPSSQGSDETKAVFDIDDNTNVSPGKDHVLTLKVTSDAINTAPGDVGNDAEFYTSGHNRGSMTPTIIIKDDNNNLVIHGDDTEDEISFNGVVQFVKKTQDSISPVIKTAKLNVKPAILNQNPAAVDADENQIPKIETEKAFEDDRTNEVFPDVIKNTEVKNNEIKTSVIEEDAGKTPYNNNKKISSFEKKTINPTDDKPDLMENIKETLIHYFRTEEKETKPENIHHKLQNILNFLKKEETEPRSSRNLESPQDYFNSKTVKSKVTKRDVDEINIANETPSMDNKPLTLIVNEKAEKDNAIDNQFTKDDTDLESGEIGTKNSLKDPTFEDQKDHKEDNKEKISNLEFDEYSFINTDDYVDYDVDYYDYYDYSEQRVETGEDNATTIDVLENENSTANDSFGNGNETEIDEFEINNSTESQVNSTQAGIEDINSLELLLSKKTCRCGVPLRKTNIKRIVGGNETEINNYPWVVQIAERKNHYVFCSGSLISDRHVVTAAHCVEGYRPKELYMRMGATTTAKTLGKVALAKSFITHPKYVSRDGTKYDIAIIRLKKAIKYTENILPICFPKIQNYENLTGIIIGWGVTEYGGLGSPTLLESSVKILEAASCRAISNYSNHEITSKVFCANGNGTDTCQGDSGGPLAIEKDSQYFLAGITSWGINCAVPEYPGIYTNVSLFSGWIKKKTGDGLFCQPDGNNGIKKYVKPNF